MNRIILLILLLFITTVGFAQRAKDTLIYNLPMVNDKLQYDGSIDVKGHNRAELSAIAKKWLFTYFKENKLSDANATLTPSKTDTTTFTLYQGLLEYHVTPGWISIPFYAIINIQVKCTKNNYTYRISDIYFRPQNGVLNAMGYQKDPNYLIKIYKQKHLGLKHIIDLDRNMIRKYLSHLNTAVLDCIASLNKAMAN